MHAADENRKSIHSNSLDSKPMRLQLPGLASYIYLRTWQNSVSKEIKVFMETTRRAKACSKNSHIKNLRH